MAQALRELGVTEEEIKDSFKFADSMAGKLAARHEVPAENERPVIERYKNMYMYAAQNPGFISSELERLKKEIEKESSMN